MPIRFPVGRTIRVLICLCGCFASIAISTLPALGQVALGWGSGDGHVLLGELGCVACHNAGAALGSVSTKQAPDLSNAGARITPQYLRAFVSSPHEIKPGTPMPDLLHAIPNSQREAAVNALVHFLVSLGGPIDQRSSGASLAQIERGRMLYHSVGCVACHQPLEAPPKHMIDPAAAAATRVIDEETGRIITQTAATKDVGHASIPHGDLAMKTTVDALAEFLDNPLQTRPSGRMPAMNLQPGEARMLAAYLLRDQFSDKETAPGVGLDFAFYEGNMPNAAELGKLDPKLEGDVKGFDLASIKLDGREFPKSNFGVRFHGLIEVPADGTYRFWTKSDDGTVLLIDGKPVINNDGMHPPTEKEGTIELRRGRHTIELAFTQGGGGYELSVHWQPPGAKSREPIPPGVLLHSAAAMIPKGIVDFAIDPQQVERGRQLFATIGCASCHSTGENGVKSTLTARPLKELNSHAAGGCLADQVAEGRPKFLLSGEQRVALRSATEMAERLGQEDEEGRIERAMTVMNCYACHSRKDKGGLATERRDYFTYEVVVDLGDEGRMPPPLNEVGAKLTSRGFEDMLFKGQRYRTYMATRMPQYGKANVGHLPELFAKADEGKVPAYKPEFSSRLVDDGRRLVGKQMLSCVNCHVWGDLKLTGVEGMDLQQVSGRLRPEWFHAWLVNPIAFKPQTRMPTAWPDGNSFYPDIQDGDMHKQIDAIWAYLSVGEKGGSPPGLSPDDKTMLVPSEHPIVFRTFLDGVSSHAILVGFRQRTHVAFDANRVRMVQAWTGDFISAKPSWDGRAGQYAQILGSDLFRLPEGPPFARLESAAESWPADVPKAKLGSTRTPPGWRFRGYRFDKHRVPTFLYSIGSIDIEETPGTEFDPSAAVVNRKFKLTTAEDVQNLYLRVAVGKTAEQTQDEIVFDDRYTYHIKASSEPFLRPVEGGQELILPVSFSAGNPREANLEIRLSW